MNSITITATVPSASLLPPPPATLMPFTHDSFGTIRAVTDATTGEPWFVARDIAEALEYPESTLNQMSNVTKLVPKEWKGLKPIMTPGGNQRMTTLSEQGLYFFLARSDKPKALPFQKWLAGEILPQIRRTGGYIPVEKEDDELSIMCRAFAILDRTVKEKDAIIEQKDALILHTKTVLQNKQGTIDAQGTVISTQAKNIAIMRPKADVFDSHVAPVDTMSITRYARTLNGVNINAVKRDLYYLGYLYKTSGASGSSGGSYRVYASFRDTLFREKVDPASGKVDIFLLDKGKIMLSKLYQSRQLTMKQGTTVRIQK